jgi:23S rRNA (guanosine2251-2'-O)-methyltransferase
MEKRNYRPVNHRPDTLDRSLLIFGLRPIMEALESGKDFEKIYLLKNMQPAMSRLITELANPAGVPISVVPEEKLNTLTRKNHQGAVAFLSPISYQPLPELVISLFEQGKNPLLMLLDRVTDVRNFGAIARSAECLGAHAIVIPSRGGAQINGDAMKTSAGALNILPVSREANLKQTIRYLQGSGIQVVACTEKAVDDLSVNAPDLSGPVALLLGSEEDGISPEYLKMADARVKIPILGTISSLNVSVAAGIMLFEAARQRAMKG